MSFDVNVLSSKPIIKAAASMQNDGGGGNLGYMSQGRQEQEGKKEEINIFAQKPDFDTFILKEDLEAPEDVEADVEATMTFRDVNEQVTAKEKTNLFYLSSTSSPSNTTTAGPVIKI